MVPFRFVKVINMQRLIKIIKTATIVLTCMLTGVQLVTAVIELMPYVIYIEA
jgi:hypothetical protein